jgi:hypothetical protein
VNELGQEIRFVELSDANNFEAKVQDLSQGIYFITAQKDGSVIYEKVVINH